MVAICVEMLTNFPHPMKLETTSIINTMSELLKASDGLGCITASKHINRAGDLIS